MGDCYPIEFVDGGYRNVLVKVRDLVYIGHTLYTHPLAGSVKPNETVYRSIAVSKSPHTFSAEQAEMMSNSIIAYDKFPPKKRILTDELLKDFQLVDYTLIAGAMEFDAAAGLAKLNIIPKIRIRKGGVFFEIGTWIHRDQGHSILKGIKA